MLLKVLPKRSKRSLPINFHSFQSTRKASKPSSQGISWVGTTLRKQPPLKAICQLPRPAGHTHAAMTSLVLERPQVLQDQQKLSNIEYFIPSHQLTNDSWEISLLVFSLQLWAPNSWETDAEVPQKWLSPTQCCSVPSARYTASLSWCNSCALQRHPLQQSLLYPLTSRLQPWQQYGCPVVDEQTPTAPGVGAPPTWSSKALLQSHVNVRPCSHLHLMGRDY